MDRTTWRQHRAPVPAQPTVLCPQSITVMHKSPGPSQTKPAVTHWQREHSIVLPVPMGGGVPPPWWPWQFSGELEGHAALRAFLLHAPALLCDFRTAFCSKSRVPRPWGSRQCQQLRELAALPVPVGTSLCAWRHEHGGTCVAPYRAQGLGLLGRAAKTESTSILAWRLLASPLVMGYLPGVSRSSCPAEQVQQLSHSTVTYKKCHLLSPRPPRRQTSSGGLPAALHVSGRGGVPLGASPRQALAGSCPCKGKHVRAAGGGGCVGKQPSALSPAPTVTGWPQTPLPEAQTGQCSGLLYPGLRPLG